MAPRDDCVAVPLLGHEISLSDVGPSDETRAQKSPPCPGDIAWHDVV
jgi:hypothetical protein